MVLLCFQLAVSDLKHSIVVAKVSVGMWPIAPLAQSPTTFDGLQMDVLNNSKIFSTLSS